MSTLRVAIGAGTRPDAADAGAAAVTEAAARLGEPAALAVVWATVHHDLPALLSSTRSVTGPALLAAPPPAASSSTERWSSPVRPSGGDAAGELARTSGVAGVHHATVAAVAR